MSKQLTYGPALIMYRLLLLLNFLAACMMVEEMHAHALCVCCIMLQGRFSFYMTSAGEEATVVASAAALSNKDMVSNRPLPCWSSATKS